MESGIILKLENQFSLNFSEISFLKEILKEIDKFANKDQLKIKFNYAFMNNQWKYYYN